MNRVLRRSALYAFVLAAVTGGGALLAGCAASETPAPKKAATPSVAADLQLESAPAKTPTLAAAELPAAKDAEAPKAAPEPKPAVAPKVPDDRRLLLETVGALTATHCYQTYLNIGLIADGKTKGTYSEKDAYKVLGSVLALLDTVDQKLAALTKLDLDKDDRDSLEQMRKLSALLRQQGKMLEAYWETGRDDDSAKYESIRKDSWAAISKLLGMAK